jgi:hypothetical protein
VVAWIALIMATLALAVALSDQAWLRQRIARWSANWSLVRQAVAESRAPADSGPDAAEQLRSASLAARLGNEGEVRERLGAAGADLTSRVERLEGSARERCQALIDDIAAVRRKVETGAEGARTLSSLAERAEALIPAEASEESPRRGRTR